MHLPGKGSSSAFLRSSLIVEFVGLPGSGKTTLTLRTGELLRHEGWAVHEAYKDWNKGLRYRLADHGSSLLRLIPGEPSLALNTYRSIARLQSVSRGQAANLALNWLNRVAHLIQGRRLGGIHLLDQGLYQLFWSIGFACGEAQLEQLLASIRLPYLPDVVVVLSVTPAASIKRLAKRPGQTSRLERGALNSESYARAEAALVHVEAILKSHLASKKVQASVSLDASHDEALMQNSRTLSKLIQARWDAATA